MSFITLPNDIIDLLSDPLVLLDKGGAVIFSNQACRDFFSQEQLNDIFKKLEPIRFQPRESGKAFCSEIQFPDNSGHIFDIHIFTINKMDNKEGISLALLKPRNGHKKSATSNFEVYLKVSLSEQEVVSRRLNPEFDCLTGEDPKFRLALFKAQKAAKTDLPILIMGESGTGKEKLAQIIHKLSDRRKRPFVDINCAAIPHNLIESELFGYERGAFTGARQKGKRGLFEEAHQGTIFLDEIGDTSTSVQSKLLRVLQEGQFKRVGGTKNVVVDLRVNSATNRNLETMISEMRFRKDLFYRLNTISLMLPSLVDRGKDIQLLADLFLEEHSSKKGKTLFFSKEALDVMDSYDWPGNIRELRGVVDYAATMTETHDIGLESLPKSLFLKQAYSKNEKRQISQSLDIDFQNTLLPMMIQQVEKTAIENALRQSTTRTEAINTLGISRKTFYRKLKQYHLSTRHLPKT